jgi:hypothetical protein
MHTSIKSIPQEYREKLTDGGSEIGDLNPSIYHFVHLKMYIMYYLKLLIIIKNTLLKIELK